MGKDTYLSQEDYNTVSVQVKRSQDIQGLTATVRLTTNTTTYSEYSHK